MNEDTNLSETLKSWKTAPAVPPGFQREVWGRIAAREAEKSAWARFNEWLTIEFVRPLVAVPALALVMALSVGLAYRQAAEARSDAWASMEASYIAAIDPLAPTTSLP